MRGTWRRFRAMPDAERARVLAVISASVIVGILYGLGGVGLYLRANFLQDTPTAVPVESLTDVPPVSRDEAPTLFPTMTPAALVTVPPGGAAATPYPTLTPRPGA